MGPELKRLVWRVARSAVFILAAVFVGFSALIYFFQERLLFRPQPLPPDHAFALEGVAEVVVPVEGAHLSALHFRQPDARGLVFFLHGNAGNLASWLTSTEFYRRTKFDLFMLDYRGFGKSSGRITSEAQLHADVRAAWNLVAPAYAGKKRVIYGRSLGTGLAAKLAAEVDADLTVLVSPYSSVRELGREFYPWLPAFIGRYPLRTDLALPGSKSPVMILHGDRDELIGLAHSRRLKALHPKAELVVIEGAAHNDIHKFPQYLDLLAARLAAL
jgi:hypothetical protein